MLKNAKQFLQRLSAFMLSVLVIAGTLFSNIVPVHATDGTISYHAGDPIYYGSFFTARMSFDGNNTAYCVEPLELTPSSGTFPGIYPSRQWQPEHCRQLVPSSLWLSGNSEILCKYCCF